MTKKRKKEEKKEALKVTMKKAKIVQVFGCVYIYTHTSKQLYNLSFIFTFATSFFRFFDFFLSFSSFLPPFLSLHFFPPLQFPSLLSLIFLSLLSISQNFLSFLGCRPIRLNTQFRVVWKKTFILKT